MTKKERRRHDLVLEKLYRARDEWNEDRVKGLDFINKRLRQKQEHTSTMLMKQWVNDIEHLQNEWNPFLLKPNYQIFTTYEKFRKMNYYLPQCVQVWKHVPFTSTLKKWLTKTKLGTSSTWSKKFKSWLARQAIWQVHLPHLKIWNTLITRWQNLVSKINLIWFMYLLMSLKGTHKNTY